MKLHYYPETESLYTEFKAGPSAETHEVSDGLNVDFGIDHAFRRLGLFTQETEGPPPRLIGVGCAMGFEFGTPREREH